LWDKANNLINQVAQRIKPPDPVLGGAVQGVIFSIDQYSCEINNDIHVNYTVMYPPERQVQESIRFEAKSLSENQLALARTIHEEINQLAFEKLNEIFGAGMVDIEEWRAKKIEVFISYRGDFRKVASQLREQLGEFGDRSVFIPRVDFVDLQEGSWIDQLEQQITNCEVFIPILTRDYLEGPVSKQEFHQAFRQAVSERQKKIIPVLLEGSISDYNDTFLDNYNFIQAIQGIDDEHVQRIANWAQGISENEFE